MCTLQNHVEKVCTLVSLYHVYFKFVYSVMAPRVDARPNLLVILAGAEVRKEKPQFGEKIPDFTRICIVSPLLSAS